MAESDLRTVNIFGVEICSVTFDEAVRIVLGWIEDKQRGCFIVTPNINHLVLYQEDSAFREAYRRASLVLPDGRYVILLSKLLKCPLPEPVNGSDLIPAILESSNNLDVVRVFLLGAMPGVAEVAAKNIQSRWPHVRVVGCYSPPLGFETDAEESRDILERVNNVAPDLLVVGISPPKQETWVASHSSELCASATICAGATIDFLAEVKRRAPVWMQHCGLEWVFRAITEPRRLIPRYLNDGFALIRLLVRELRKK